MSFGPVSPERSDSAIAKENRVRSSIQDFFLFEQRNLFQHADGETHDLLRKILQCFSDLLAVDELILSSLGARPGRLVLLMVLGKHAKREMTPTELAKTTGVTRATMSEQLDGLVTDGLVGRRPDPQDRRIVRVFLTQAGGQFVQRVGPTYFEWHTRALAPLTADERMELVAILQKLRRRITEVAASLAPKA